jgi:hypothetical protein
VRTNYALAKRRGVVKDPTRNDYAPPAEASARAVGKNQKFFIKLLRQDSRSMSGGRPVSPSPRARGVQ